MAPKNTPLQKWGPRPEPYQARLDKRGFQNLEYIGSVPSKTRMSTSTTTMTRKESIFNNYSPATTKLKELAGNDFFVVSPTQDMVENVMKTWDQKVPTSYHGKIYDFSRSFFEIYYGPLFRDSKAPDDHVFDWMDFTKSPGYPASYFGLKSKGATYGDPGFQKFRDEYTFDIHSHVYHKVVPKIEFLPKENIDMLKCRLFVIPELLLLEKQLKFGKSISLRLKNYKWSAYGFNPYAGGCNSLAQRLLTKRVRFYYDVSGWDKFIPLLRDIFSSIKKFNGYEKWSIEDRKQFDWMVKHTVEMMCVMFDGSLYCKKYGNGSGSGTTTRDNILAHVIIMAFILCSAYHDKYGEFPHPMLLDSQIINLFGDDSICAVDECFDFVLKEGYVAGIFAQFGMKLKFFWGGLDYPLEKMEFLGFTFHKTPMGYIPLYNEKRLATAMVYNGVNSNTREATLSRIFIITYMSFPCENHVYFKRYATDVAELFSRRSDLTETEKVMCDLILTMNEEQIMSLFLGLEGHSSQVLNFFSCFEAAEVGIKELLSDVGRRKY